MPYIELQDLVDEIGTSRLIELTDDEGSEEINEAVVAKAIASAEGVFESYVRTRYSLPVPATQFVKSRCIKIAVYELYRKRATFDEGIFKVHQSAYNETIAILKDLQAGRAALDVPAAEETIETPATGDKILTNAAKAKFNDQILSGF